MEVIKYTLSTTLPYHKLDKLKKIAAAIAYVFSVKDGPDTPMGDQTIIIGIQDTMSKEDIFMFGVTMGVLEGELSKKP